MKYLGIHKLLWLLLVVVYTLLDLLLIGIDSLFYIMWHFKIPKNQWRKCHTYNKFNLLTNNDEVVYVKSFYKI